MLCNSNVLDESSLQSPMTRLQNLSNKTFLQGRLNMTRLARDAHRLSARVACRESNSTNKSSVVPLNRWVSQVNTNNAATTTSTSSLPSDQTPKESETKPAKISFMVTTAMKQQLEELHYTAERVKKMTPLEASLILQHEVAPSDQESQLPELLRTFEAKQEAEAKRTQAQAASTAADKSKRTQLPYFSFASTNLLHAPFLSPTEPDAPKVWYEVVEETITNAAAGVTTEQHVIGLYQKQEEAELGKETQELFAERRAKDNKRPNTSTFLVRSTQR